MNIFKFKNIKNHLPKNILSHIYMFSIQLFNRPAIILILSKVQGFLGNNTLPFSTILAQL